MRLKIIKTFCLVLSFYDALAQVPEIEAPEAEALFQQHAYAEAIQFYQKRIDLKKVNGNVYYKAGICYLRSRSQQKRAISCFEKAIELSTSFYPHSLSKESDAPMDVYLYLAEAYRLQFQPEKALTAVQAYQQKLLQSNQTDTLALRLTDQKIQHLTYEVALKLHYELPANFKFPPFTKNAQNEVGDFSANLSLDKAQMVYSIKVPLSQVSNSNDALFFEDSGIALTKTAEKKTNPKKQNDVLPDTVINTATLGTSKDGQAMLTYKNDAGYCHLYLQSLLANEWSRASRINRSPNSAGWEEGEYQTPDGRTLYFISDRPGGFGGFDLYACSKLADGKWSKAVNLGPGINTEFDEVAPFPLADGNSLYFSSNRQHPKKSFDIYIAERTNLLFNKIKLTGYPVNSSEDNMYYQVVSDKKKLLAEVRKETKHKLKETEKADLKKLDDSVQYLSIKWRDNYLLSFETAGTEGLSILKTGVKKTLKTEILAASEFTLTDLSTGKTAQRMHCDIRGGLELIIPAGITCGLSSRSENYISDSYLIDGAKAEHHLEKFGPLNLHKLEAGVKWEIETIQFEALSDQFKKISATELQCLYNFLLKYPNSKIRIHYLLKSTENSYRYLAEKRADKILQHLKERGIDEKRLKTKTNFQHLTAPIKIINGKKEIRLEQQLRIELMTLTKKK